MPIQIVPTFEDPSLVTPVNNPTAPVVWGVAPKLQFDNADGEIFVFNDSGQMVLGAEGETLEQLVTKSVVTDRLVFPIYDENFGSDFWTLIGKGYTDATVQSLAKKFIEEAVSGIDTIRSVDQITTELVGDQLYIHFRIVTLTGYASTFDFARLIK